VVSGHGRVMLQLTLVMRWWWKFSINGLYSLFCQVTGNMMPMKYGN